MPKTYLLRNVPPIPIRARVLFLLTFVLLGGLSAQQIPENFKQKAKNLINRAPKDFGTIDNTFKTEKRDTVLMGYLNQLSKSEGYLEGQAYALNHIGRTLRNLSQEDKAETYHKKALAISEQANSIDFEVLSLNWLGVVYRRIDAVKTALDYNQKALELAESVENPSYHIKRSINVSLNCIGLLYRALEQYDLAIEQFERALKLEKELDNKLGLAINHQNIGDCFEQKGLLDQALDNYLKSLEYNELINSNMGRIICKNSIAQVRLKQDMPNVALNLLEPLQEQAIGLGDNLVTSSVFINSGWAQMKLRQLGTAEKNFERGLQIAEQYNMPSIAQIATKRLSELEELKGNQERALEYYKKMYDYDKQITNSTNFRYMNDMIQRYESEKKNDQIEVLTKQKEQADIRLRKNQTTLLVSALAACLLASILYILYRKYQTNNERRVLSLEQNMLRSQMNPHFLFNSLNSIKLYIINNEQKNAVHYLNKFSKLVRKILEASSQKEISLAEELETVELYMNIENIRFNNAIDFKIAVDDDINLDQIKIPSLALQPFLENALWHGLSPKEGEKKIELQVIKKNNGHITISIEDNGVGRAAAEVNKENRVLKRKSVGIDITKERLANFAKDYHNDFEVEIVDLFDDSGNARGTKVVINVPTV
ncbi:tetratricopeptide repeat protein [Allomuricauda sp. d1]|uniref:tetratricopeptide repeat-containing sensor histidine kinase n=1 Tax=Allomuricauda sp. d1 TaxID=3136725 RepID=UPI0031E165FF